MYTDKQGEYSGILNTWDLSVLYLVMIGTSFNKLKTIMIFTNFYITEES